MSSIKILITYAKRQEIIPNKYYNKFYSSRKRSHEVSSNASHKTKTLINHKIKLTFDSPRGKDDPIRISYYHSSLVIQFSHSISLPLFYQTSTLTFPRTSLLQDGKMFLQIRERLFFIFHFYVFKEYRYVMSENIFKL